MSSYKQFWIQMALKDVVKVLSRYFDNPYEYLILEIPRYLCRLNTKSKKVHPIHKISDDLILNKSM